MYSQANQVWRELFKKRRSLKSESDGTFCVINTFNVLAERITENKADRDFTRLKFSTLREINTTKDAVFIMSSPMIPCPFPDLLIPGCRLSPLLLANSPQKIIFFPDFCSLLHVCWLFPHLPLVFPFLGYLSSFNFSLQVVFSTRLIVFYYLCFSFYISLKM